MCNSEFIDMFSKSLHIVFCESCSFYRRLYKICLNFSPSDTANRWKIWHSYWQYHYSVNFVFPYLVGCVAQLAERRSLAGELTLSCARPAADGWPVCGWTVRYSQL